MAQYVLSTSAAVARAVSVNNDFYTGLRPVIIGPRAGLHRFSVPAEQALLGPYNNVSQTAYAYPNQATGSVVDLPSVELWASVAYLNYFNKFVGINGSCISLTTAPNEVYANQCTFQTANGYSRSTALGDRDVQIGDVAYIYGIGTDSNEYSVNTVVTGFVPNVIAASVGSATGDPNNAATQTLATSISQVANTPINDIVATASGAAYESSADGYISRTYTVTVTQSSIGGNATTARLSVISSDGLDNQTNVTPSAFGSPTAIGTKGLTVTFTYNSALGSTSGVDENDLLIGQSWTVSVSEAWTAPVATAAGTYTGAKTTTYIVAVTTGGLYTATQKPVITVTSTTGYDRSGPTVVSAASTAVTIGNYGVTISFNHAGLRKGDVYYVVCTGPGSGAVQTLVFRDNIPPLLAGQQVNLQLMVERTNLSIAAVQTIPSVITNWTCNANGITVNSGLALLDPAFTTGGLLFAVPLYSATLYVQYREWLVTSQLELLTLTEESQIAANLGTVDITNPIAWHASFALQNTAIALGVDSTDSTATTTSQVLCVATSGPPTVYQSWTDALNLIADNDEAYGLVPCSHDPNVLQLFVNHVTAQSEDSVGLYRVCWLPTNLTTVGPIVNASNTTDGNPALATVTLQSGSSPAQYIIVTASANAQFITNGVQAGDTLRINFGLDPFDNQTYNSYTVASVTSQTTLVLTSGPSAPISVARQMEIWRTFTKDQLVSQVTAVAAGYNNSRVMLVFPDQPSIGGVVQFGSTLCAALAGLAGSVCSQQGLKFVQVQGFDNMTRASQFFTGTQLDTMAAGGVFIVSQTPGGVIYVRNAVSTDPSTTSTREEMYTRNSDMVRKAIQGAWAQYVGSGNVISNLTQLLSGALATLQAQLTTGNFPVNLGPPVGTLAISSLTTTSDPTVILATLTATGLALPLNQLQLTLPVS